MKAWTYKKLREYLIERGYNIEKTRNNEWEVVNNEGHVIEFFAVSHGKGLNREIKGPYIKKIGLAWLLDNLAFSCDGS